MRPQSVPRVLVVEDDAVVRRAIRLACEKDGLRVSEAVSGPQALESLARERPDLVLLDLLLPGLSGLDVCRAIRRVDDTLPVIMVTAKGEETDKVVGLELGADDYIAKPFGPRELVARVRAVLRRQAALRRHLLHAGEAEAPLRFGELAIWPEGRQVRQIGRAHV
jgi:DNA-binding response OmpR family regulator